MYQSHHVVLGDAAWADLCALAQPHRRPAGTVLLRQGEQSTHVLALASGSVTVSLRGSSGNPTLLAFRHVGELLGDLGVLTRTPRTATVTAATDCLVHIIPAATFLDHVAEHGLLSQLLAHAVTRIREAEQVRLELAADNVPARLASMLSRLLATAPREHLGSKTVNLTQADLAQLIGASRNAVGSALKKWRLRGWLQVSASGGLVVHDIDAIREHAALSR